MMGKYLVFNKAGLEVIHRKEVKTYFKPPPKLSECGARLARGYQDLNDRQTPGDEEKGGA